MADHKISSPDRTFTPAQTPHANSLRDPAVHENVAWLRPHNRRLGDTRVGALSQPPLTPPLVRWRWTYSRSRGSRAAGRGSVAGRSWGQLRWYGSERGRDAPGVSGADAFRPALVTQHELFLWSAGSTRLERGWWGVGALVVRGQIGVFTARLHCPSGAPPASLPAQRKATTPTPACPRTHQLGIQVRPVLLRRAIGPVTVVGAGRSADPRTGRLRGQLAAEEGWHRGWARVGWRAETCGKVLEWVGWGGAGLSGRFVVVE